MRKYAVFVLGLLLLATMAGLTTRDVKGAVPNMHIFAQVGNPCGQNGGAGNWTGTPHGVCVSYTAPNPVGGSGTISGYHIWRGTVTGGPYTNLTPVATANLFFLDQSAAVSTTYFYVATTLDSNGNESAYSTQASITTPATFPSNPNAPATPTTSIH